MEGVAKTGGALGVIQVGLGSWGAPPRPIEQPPLALTERAAVRDGEEPETAASDNVGSLAAALGLIESIETGGPVEVTAHPSWHGRG